MSDLHDFRLAKRAETYMQEQQMQRQQTGQSQSVSKTHYDVAESRREAFG